VEAGVRVLVDVVAVVELAHSVDQCESLGARQTGRGRGLADAFSPTHALAQELARVADSAAAVRIGLFARKDADPIEHFVSFLAFGALPRGFIDCETVRDEAAAIEQDGFTVAARIAGAIHVGLETLAGLAHPVHQVPPR